MHILPPGFTRIRHYGFLSSAAKRKALGIIRGDLKVTVAVKVNHITWQEIAFERMGVNPGICKCCGGKMVIIKILPNSFYKQQRAPPDNLLQENFQI